MRLCSSVPHGTGTPPRCRSRRGLRRSISPPGWDTPGPARPSPASTRPPGALGSTRSSSLASRPARMSHEPERPAHRSDSRAARSRRRLEEYAPPTLVPRTPAELHFDLRVGGAPRPEHPLDEGFPNDHADDERRDPGRSLRRERLGVDPHPPCGGGGCVIGDVDEEPLQGCQPACARCKMGNGWSSEVAARAGVGEERGGS